MLQPLSVYLNEVLDFIQHNSIAADKLNWEQVRPESLAQAQAAKTTADLYPLIRAILAQLGDNHSFLLEPANVQKVLAYTPGASDLPQGRQLTSTLGYLNLPAIMGNPAALQAYARAAQQILRDLDRAGVKGWIVDLRENSGGNMFPMLAGLGPLLGVENFGSFVYPGGKRQAWRYREGGLWVDDWLGLQIEEPYKLQESLPPVAILTGRSTLSSGEITLIAFRGRPKTRSFGENTSGLPTCNDQKRLNDGAILNLTVALCADRLGRPYHEAIPPDESIEELPGEVDPVLLAAQSWLEEQIAG